MHVKITRKNTLFSPDSSRIIPRFLYTTESRSIEIIKTVLAMPESEVNNILKPLLRDFSTRHRNITRIFKKHVDKLVHIFDLLDVNMDELSLSRKALLGSYFTMEYSIESAAFYNPSIIEDPDQSELRPDEKRVILSFRATGEGYISSIVFRSGILDRNNDLSVEPIGKMLAEADVITQSVYNKKIFLEKLEEMQGAEIAFSAAFIMDKLDDNFTYDELIQCLNDVKQKEPSSAALLISQIKWLASTHYEIDFSIDSAISERVIFPVSSDEKNGIEDARFVKFTDDDGEVTYYATITANDGVTIISKLIMTTDFYHFRILPLHGEIVHNKGMALFPRKINGKYAMLCQIDGVNNFIAYSDKINIWREAVCIQQPTYPWELLKIGNAGSPIETEDGWLVITQAVGPMKKCVISAALFDLNNPEKEIGRLNAPLIMSNDTEREGAVPNVVFSCGSVIHGEDLVIPYSLSDHSSAYAAVNLKELLNEIKSSESTNNQTFVGTIERRTELINESKMQVA